MNIITCIKQVPGSSEVQIDPVTGVLIRDGSNCKMNPYDLYAIETALRIKEQNKAHIASITMGPPSAMSVLQESLWMGCDQAALLTDRQFAGADVVATAYTLSQGIKKIGPYDLIICGKQTTDGDTAQVGPEIAEYLKIPHVAYVDRILEIKEDAIVVSTSMDKTVEIWEIAYPCLITVEKGIFTPRLPSYKRSLACNKEMIKQLTLQDMEDKNPDHYGLKGSPTQVERMFPPTKNTEKVIWEGENLATKIALKLQELKLL